MDFWERFEDLLKANSISRKDLAEKIGIRRPLISEWKRKKSFPYADVAVEISKILGVSVEYLITGKDPAGFSLGERDLVAKYRSLSGDNQRNVLALVDSMLSDPVGKKAVS